MDQAQLLTWFLLVACFYAKLQTTSAGDRPLIGVLAMKITDETIFKHFKWTKDKSYIAASYVKWLESAGARVVPIRNDMSEKNLTYLFKSINGILFPGGEINLEDSEYYKTGKKLFHKIVKANNHDNFFPAFGICRGSQAIAVFAEETIDILTQFDAKNMSLTMKFSDDYKKSRMFANLSDSLKNAIENEPITAHYHKYGIKPEEFTKYKKLKTHFRILGTSENKKGQFVSAFEGVDYPFYTTVWHPEKPAYEWNVYTKTKHTKEAIEVGQYLGNFFVNEAKKNKNKFRSYEEELGWVIDNYYPIHSGIVVESHTPFDQIYVF